MTKQRLRLEEAPDVMSVMELARVLGVGRNTAYGLLRANVIRSIRIGRVIRVPKEAVRQFLEGGSGAPRGDAA